MVVGEAFTNMTTQMARNVLSQDLESDLIYLKKEFINGDIALLSIVVNLTEYFSPVRLVVLSTELIGFIYDASLKVNEDLVDELRDQSKTDNYGLY